MIRTFPLPGLKWHYSHHFCFHPSSPTTLSEPHFLISHSFLLVSSFLPTFLLFLQLLLSMSAMCISPITAFHYFVLGAVAAKFVTILFVCLEKMYLALCSSAANIYPRPRRWWWPICPCTAAILDKRRSHTDQCAFHTTNEWPHTFPAVHKADAYAWDSQSSMQIGPEGHRQHIHLRCSPLEDEYFSFVGFKNKSRPTCWNLRLQCIPLQLHKHLTCPLPHHWCLLSSTWHRQGPFQKNRVIPSVFLDSTTVVALPPSKLCCLNADSLTPMICPNGWSKVDSYKPVAYWICGWSSAKIAPRFHRLCA